jgi:hypothetical protein
MIFYLKISTLKAAQRNLVPFVFDDLLPLEASACTPKVTINGLVEKYDMTILIIWSFQGFPTFQKPD